jgi:hypothetical protein
LIVEVKRSKVVTMFYCVRSLENTMRQEGEISIIGIEKEK